MSKYYYTDKEPDCSNCPCRRSQIALGLGMWCSNEENKNRDVGFGIHGLFKQPLLPFSQACICNHYEGKIEPKLEYVKIEDLPDLPPYPFVKEELEKS